MNTNKTISIFLVFASLIGFYVGVGLLFFPEELQAESNIVINSPSQFSEARAPGAAIFFTSVFILISAFKKSWQQNALRLASLFFLAYGLGRLLSLVLDGRPADGLFYAMIGELLVGSLALLLLMKSQKEINQ